MGRKARDDICLVCGPKRNARWDGHPQCLLLDRRYDSQCICVGCFRQNARAVELLQQDESRGATLKRRRLRVLPVPDTALRGAAPAAGRMEIDADTTLLQREGVFTRAAGAAQPPAGAGGGGAGGGGAAAPEPPGPALAGSSAADDDPGEFEIAGKHQRGVLALEVA